VFHTLTLLPPPPAPLGAKMIKSEKKQKPEIERTQPNSKKNKTGRVKF